MRFDKISSVNGILEFEGDKSISHRAVIFSSLAEGESVIKNISLGEDVRRTIECFEKMGIDFYRESEGLTIQGRGLGKLLQPTEPLFCGNSGTTARLISGILACQQFDSQITGDSSLSNRPMKRIVEPLREMGGIVKARDNNFLPIDFKISKQLEPLNYFLSVPSAQVKSALILAAIHLEGISVISEQAITRDHTELMLGLRTEVYDDKRIIYASRADYPKAKNYFIPGDISTAAFFIVLALITKNSELLIKRISYNPTRTGFISILQKMGGDIKVIKTEMSNGELIADLLIRSSNLSNIKIEKDLIPIIIDEIPVLAIAGLFATGDFEINGARELRAKESDRIVSICGNLRNAGAEVDEYDEGFSIKGNKVAKSAIFRSYDDHRIIMAMTILSLLLENGGKIDNFECVKISNPNFIKQLEKVCR